MTIAKVLIANRGEIAVRVARACRDAGLASAAVYADPDRDAPHVRAADEAYALGGDTPAASYLDIGKILAAAAKSGADAVHPGYGFLSENADFAQAVLDAGLTWIGPPPQAIRDLGDKVAARKIAQRAGAPLVAGTPDPVSGADEVVAFAKEHGLPVAIKAAFGGGGRGLKVARTLEEIPELYESAVREAVGAFGRGECFVERYLDKPRHVETQCLADTHGTVVVVSTRDCSLQRRHQKLVEEAPAPYLSSAQADQLRSASKAILREAGYVGAGTCEFLVGQDGTISFLEVNTRLQVEHPVTEEVTGIDLVREMFRIADGEALGYDDPPQRGHSIEFRINAEDPGRNFLPGPGTVTTWQPPSGPGVRLDAGVQAGSVIGPAWDSLLAKLIVTGATRQQALQRAARALAEFQAGGLATALPFHRAVVTDPAFAPELHGSDGPFSVHTRWIETEFRNDIAPWAGGAGTDADGGDGGRQAVTVEVDGKRIEVTLPAAPGFGGAATGSVQPPAQRGGAPRRQRGRGPRAGAASGNALTAPMQGTVIKVAVSEGQQVEAGDLIIVLEAMKMEQPVNAHKAGTVASLSVQAGGSLTSGAVICEITDLPHPPPEENQMSHQVTQGTGHESAELAKLLLRGALAGTMIAHGLRHARTLDGTAGWFRSIGFRQHRLQAQLSAAVEIGAGAALAAGAATPLSASAVVGTMGVAYRTVHRPNGYFITAEGWEYVGFISAASVALAALGPGKFSADHLLGLDRVGKPWQRAALAAGLGIGGAAAQLAAFWRQPEPKTAQPAADAEADVKSE